MGGTPKWMGCNGKVPIFNITNDKSTASISDTFDMWLIFQHDILIDG